MLAFLQHPSCAGEAALPGVHGADCSEKAVPGGTATWSEAVDAATKEKGMEEEMLVQQEAGRWGS